MQKTTFIVKLARVGGHPGSKNNWAIRLLQYIIVSIKGKLIIIKVHPVKILKFI